MEMKYSVQDLIQVLEENMADHEKVYDEAMDGFRQRVEDELLEVLSKIQTFRDADEEWDAADLSGGDGFRPLSSFVLSITEPEYHGDDYARVLEMLRMTTDKEIVLSENQFSKYVQDEWDWTDSFNNTTAMYMAR